MGLVTLLSIPESISEASPNAWRFTSILSKRAENESSAFITEASLTESVGAALGAGLGAVGVGGTVVVPAWGWLVGGTVGALLLANFHLARLKNHDNHLHGRLIPELYIRTAGDVVLHVGGSVHNVVETG